ncbi:MAG: hypothetical protein GF344_05840 [Chitinivibrionales bacterium]|nr:hypothetical protein [Chitinivibrionales bacterium]
MSSGSPEAKPSEIVREVAGERISVTGIFGEGVDPHPYKPTRQDVVILSNADIVFYNGLMLEGKMGDVLVKVAAGGKTVHVVTERLLEEGDYVMTDEAEHYDPHVWMDVSGWMKAVEVVTQAPVDFDSQGAGAYRSNTQGYHRRSVLWDIDIPEGKLVGIIGSHGGRS